MTVTQNYTLQSHRITERTRARARTQNRSL